MELHNHPVPYGPYLCTHPDTERERVGRIGHIAIQLLRERTQLS